MIDDRMLTLGQAARELRVSDSTLRRWVDAGTVPAIMLPSGYRRFTREQLDQIKMDMGLIPKELAA